ncbi:hypothetical protein C4588_06480 [Candidatus Parcubacteria bacterium]|nr:MAG: hypothetical protein C4588_06480 [Candidatus Parcubacteria bacterium]
MYSRHYRYNPLFSNPTVTDVQDPLAVSFFDSIIKARAFLTQVSCLNPKQLSDPQTQSKIEAAKKMVARADKRNEKRRARRARKKSGQQGQIYLPARLSESPSYSTRSVATCDEAKQSVKVLCPDTECRPIHVRRAMHAPLPQEEITWEEVLGPKGETIRFKVEYHKEGPEKGKVKEKKRALKAEPQIGEIILDLTTGIQAWRVTESGRTTMPVSKRMRDFYRQSYLYRVRQLAAGIISPTQFVKYVKEDSAFSAKKSLKRKKR